MKIYHGSLEVVEHPMILQTNRKLDYGFTLQECLNRIYHSNLYKKLSTESTKYWHLGPVDLYEELKMEL